MSGVAHSAGSILTVIGFAGFAASVLLSVAFGVIAHRAIMGSARHVRPDSPDGATFDVEFLQKEVDDVIWGRRRPQADHATLFVAHVTDEGARLVQRAFACATNSAKTRVLSFFAFGGGVLGVVLTNLGRA